MSAQTGPTPTEAPVLPEDPEAVVSEISEPSGEDYDPPDRIDPAKDAAEADMIDQATEVPQEDEEAAEPAAE